MHGSTLHEKIFDVRMRQIAPIALILVGAVGCTSSSSGGPTSSPSPTQPVSTSASPTPTAPSTSASSTPSVAATGPNVRPGEKPPTYPAVSKTNTRSGALSFAAYWLEAWDWAYATMNTALLSTSSASSCSDCTLVIQGFAQARHARQHFVGGRLIFESSTFAPNDGRYGAQQAVDVNIGERSLRIVDDSSGKTVHTDPAVQSATFRFWLKWTGARWIAVQKAHVT